MGRADPGAVPHLVTGDELEPEPPAEDTPPRPRLSALDSEILRVDDRILELERAGEKMIRDVGVMREILIDQIVTVALLQLALAIIIGVLAFAYWKERDGSMS